LRLGRVGVPASASANRFSFLFIHELLLTSRFLLVLPLFEQVCEVQCSNFSFLYDRA
jgi:hypothetical protein